MAKKKQKKSNLRPKAHVARHKATLSRSRTPSKSVSKKKAVFRGADVASTSTTTQGRSGTKGKATQQSLKPKAVDATHVLVRVRSDDGTTISEHYRIVESSGRALIGKVGRALGDEFMNGLNAQITSGITTYLFLTTRHGWGGDYVTYLCDLAAVHPALPPEKRSLVPTYYSEEFSNIGTWFEITSMYELDRSQMNEIQVVSSGRSIISAIAGMASVFRVRLTSVFAAT